MSRLIEQLRNLCGNCILAPQNRNADRLKPCCDTCELRWKAADELDRLQAKIASLESELDETCGADGRHIALLIRERMRSRAIAEAAAHWWIVRDRMRTIIDGLPTLLMACHDVMCDVLAAREGRPVSPVSYYRLGQLANECRELAEKARAR